MKNLALILISLTFVACAEHKNKSPQVLTAPDDSSAAMDSNTKENLAKLEGHDFCFENSEIVFDTEESYTDGNWARQATPAQPLRQIMANGEVIGYWSVEGDILTTELKGSETPREYKITTTEELNTLTTMSLTPVNGGESMNYEYCGAKEVVKKKMEDLNQLHDKRERN